MKINIEWEICWSDGGGLFLLLVAFDEVVLVLHTDQVDQSYQLHLQREERPKNEAEQENTGGRVGLGF